MRDLSVAGHPEFRWILQAWKQWGYAEELRSFCTELTNSDAGLFALLGAFLQHTKSVGATDRMVKLRPRLNPAWLEPFVDIESVAVRLLDLQQRGSIPEGARVAGSSPA